jgi:hypothetical protein
MKFYLFFIYFLVWFINEVMNLFFLYMQPKFYLGLQKNFIIILYGIYILTLLN